MNLVGFIGVTPFPSGTMNNAKRIHRLVILPDYQGMKFGTKFLEEIADLYVKRGWKVHIRTAHEKLGMHMERSSLWKATQRNAKKGAYSNGEINGKNQNPYIVDSIRYSYEYVGADYSTKEHIEFVVDDLTDIDMGEMRKMLLALKRNNYITIVHSRVRENTALNKLCHELGIRTELLYLNRKGEVVLNGKHRGKKLLLSLKKGQDPVYGTVK